MKRPRSMSRLFWRRTIECGPWGRRIPGFDHIPFLSKEVWVNDHRPGEIHVIFVWESLESWRKVDDPQLQKGLAAQFEEAFPHPYRLVRKVEEEEEYGIHRYSRFERL